MSNKKVLSKATRELNKVKAPSKPRDIIYDPMGQWAHPGQPTRIPSNDITMQGVPFPVWAQPNVGPGTMMQPGGEYQFPGADYVDEYPQMKRGGLKKNKTSRSLMATNKLFAKHAFFKKPGKNVIFDPNSPNYQDGGFILELDDNEIQAYKDGGYIVEDISVPELQDGGEEPELNLNLPEQAVYGNEEKRKLQGSLIDKYNQAKKAYQDYRENAGLSKQRLKSEGASSIGVLKGQVKEYKGQLEEEKKSFDRAQKALNVLQKKDPENWKNKKLKDVMSPQGVDALRSLYKDGKMSDASFKDFYDNFGNQYDREATKTTAEDQVKLEDSWYGKKDEQGRRRWMGNPMNVKKVAQAVAVGAPLAPLAIMGAPAVMAGGKALLGNQLVQGALTADGLYTAATETAPELINNIKNREYLKGAENLGYLALDVAPGLSFAKNTVKNLKGIANYGNDIIQTSKQAGKLSLPKYKNVYRVEHADFNQAAKADDLTGRWFVDNPVETKFYAQNLKDPVTGDIIKNVDAPTKVMQQRFPEYKIKQQFGANMPEDARVMSMGKGNLTNTQLDDVLGSGASERFKKGRFTSNDLNSMSTAPFLYNPAEGILDPNVVNKVRNNIKPGMFDTGKSTVFNNQDEAVNYLFKEADNIYKPKSKLKQYMPFQKGGELFTMKGSNSVYRKVNGKWEVDTNRSGKFQPLSKGDVKQRTAVLNKQATPLFDPEYQDRINTQSEQYINTKPTKSKKQLTQENFNKNFGVIGKDNYTKYKDKVQENLKLWAGDRDKYADYDDGEWESSVEDYTTKEMNNAFDNSMRQELVKVSGESTDTQGYKLLNKQLSEDKLNKLYQSRNKKQAVVDSYVESIKKSKPFGKDAKKNKEYQDKAISDIRNKFIENPDQAYSIAHNSLTHDAEHGVKALPKGSVKTGPSIYDILTNPFDAFKYSVMTGDVSNMPANYNKFKRAGINPLDSQGGNLVGDALNMGYNPIDMVDKVYYHTRQGDGWNTALNAARALPVLKGLSKTTQGAKVLSGLNSKVVQPLEKVLDSPMPGLVKATQKSSPLLQKFVENATINNALKGRALTSSALQLPDLYNSGDQVINDLKSGNFNKNNALEFLETAANVGLTTIPYTKIPTWSKRANDILDRSTNPYWFSKAYWGAVDPDKNLLEYSSPIPGGKLFDVLTLLKTLPADKRKGGEPNSMETELTDAEIDQLKKQGYVIELI